MLSLFCQLARITPLQDSIASGMMVMEERGICWSNDTTRIIGQLHSSFAEEAERMRSFHKGQISETGNNNNCNNSNTSFVTCRTSAFFPTKRGFSSAETVTTVTDCERTSNSGSETGTGIPFQALVDMSSDERAWRMRSVESCSGFNTVCNDVDDDMENGTSLEDDMKESNEDMEMVCFLGKDGESVQSKLCPRGHWRPAEDEKLRELVSQFGPQNWNLIAEKLQGRSGTVLLNLRAS